jgi:hypothetical protein
MTFKNLNPQINEKQNSLEFHDEGFTTQMHTDNEK